MTGLISPLIGAGIAVGGGVSPTTPTTPTTPSPQSQLRGKSLVSSLTPGKGVTLTKKQKTI
jgi:hypothetical protein